MFSSATDNEFSFASLLLFFSFWKLIAIKLFGETNKSRRCSFSGDTTPDVRASPPATVAFTAPIGWHLSLAAHRPLMLPAGSMSDLFRFYPCFSFLLFIVYTFRVSFDFSISYRFY